jgi:hypothetical protein
MRRRRAVAGDIGRNGFMGFLGQSMRAYSGLSVIASFFFIKSPLTPFPLLCSALFFFPSSSCSSLLCPCFAPRIGELNRIPLLHHCPGRRCSPFDILFLSWCSLSLKSYRSLPLSSAASEEHGKTAQDFSRHSAKKEEQDTSRQ